MSLTDAGEMATSDKEHGTERSRSKVGGHSRIVKLWYSVASVCLGLGIWQFFAWYMGPSLVASPQTAWAATVELVSDGTLFQSSYASLRRIIIGWGAGILVGVPLGILMARIRVVRLLLDPYIEFFRFIPPIAFVTLAIAWFGIGETSKVILIFYTSVFIITINTIAGVLSINESKLLAASSLGASKSQVFISVVLPSTVPHIVTASRLALGN